MPYWVYGRDGETGQPTDPFFSEADNEVTARAEATGQGMIVESAERHVAGEQASGLEVQHATSEPSPGRPGRGSYEFTPEQNQVIAGLASSMQIVGFVLIIVGGLQIALGLVKQAENPAFGFLQGLLGIAIGALTVGASGAFRKVVESEGDDIEFMMAALGALQALYRFQVLLLCVALALLLLALVLTAVARP